MVQNILELTSNANQQNTGVLVNLTTEDLTNDLDITGARLTELREAGFNVKAKAQETGVLQTANDLHYSRRRVHKQTY